MKLEHEVGNMKVNLFLMMGKLVPCQGTTMEMVNINHCISNHSHIKTACLCNSAATVVK